MKLQKPIEIQETVPANPRYGWNVGDTDTYHTVQVWAFNDDHEGYELTADSFSALERTVRFHREQTLARSRPNGWDDGQAFEVGRPRKHIVRYV
jgi:hypothetical protein